MRISRYSIGLLTALSLFAPLLTATSARADLTTEPEHGAWFGANVKPETGHLRSDVEAAVTGLERDLGVKLGIDQHFFPWGKAIPGWQAAWDVENGRLPLVTWGDVDVADVTAGVHDAYIAQRADAMKAVGAPILLRWFAEMDGGAKQHLSRSPAEYIAAWKHIHGIFQRRGASNVEWVWCPNAWGFTAGQNAPAWYPGDAYVDWLCADGYNWAPGDPKAKWRDLGWIFGDFYNWGLATGKPMMIGETGVQERLPGEKAAWIAEAALQMKTLFPRMKAFVYFDVNRLYDWRIRTSAESLKAFALFAQDPYFRPNDAPPPGVDPVEDPDPIEDPDPAPDPTPDAEPPVEGDLQSQPVPDMEIVTTPRGGKKRKLQLTVTNEGSAPGEFGMTGSWSKRRVKVRFVLDGVNVTGAVAQGASSLPVIAPGDTVDVRMIAKIRGRKASVGLSVWELDQPSNHMRRRVKLQRRS